MAAFSSVQEQFFEWLLNMRWGRIAANGVAAFFTVLGGTVAVGGGDTLALKAALVGAVIQAGLAAAQEFKRENSHSRKTDSPENKGKLLCLLF